MIARIYTVLIVLIITQTGLWAQCGDYIKKECLPKFGEFIHDGNNNVAEMKEGETAELYKTFFSGHTYRLVVCKADYLPDIHVRVVDSDGKILFDNKDHNFDLIWDFAVKGTQKLVVQIEVMRKTTSETLRKSGCVGILFGVDNTDF